jgi:hypothetical protein
MLSEAVFNDLFESEDRNRAYLWSVSPFYSVPFFDHAMGCSNRVKSYARLQKKFLLTISPSAATINKAEFGCSILSNRFRLIEFIVSLKQRYPILKKVMDKIRRQRVGKDNSTEIKCLRDQMSNCESICSYLNRYKLNDILDNPGKFSPSGISVLFTIVSPC